MNINTISVVGLGYIGLPTAAMFASHKQQVIGVDIEQSVVNTINRGDIHIIEPGLRELVQAGVKEGYLRATTQAETADVFLIAVPTPFKTNHEPDLRYINRAAKAIAPVLKKGNLVILESTSPVGTTEQLATWLAEARPDLSFPQNAGEKSDIRICYCPERVLPGQAMRELMENDRVIGGMTMKCAKAAANVYRIFLKGECALTTSKTAEMSKLTENSFRDVNIAFANELSMLCDDLDINVWELIKLANRHPRVNILQPGAGVGGHCISVDPWFIVSRSPDKAKLIQQARLVNDSKPQWVCKKVKKLVQELVISGKELTVAVLGLTFKPDIDDLRESPALSIAQQLDAELSEKLLIVEPNIDKLPDNFSKARKENLDVALQQADIFIVLVAHQEFMGLARKLKYNQQLLSVVDDIE